jgi:hypothetical protein
MAKQSPMHAAISTRVLRRVIKRWNAKQRPTALDRYCSELECGHVITHMHRGLLPDIGDCLVCRRCTNAARGR